MTIALEPLSGTFVADPAHSTFQFTVKHMGVSLFRATFADVVATVVIETDGVQLDGAAEVDSISIKTPPEFREHVVNSSDFFDARNYPKIAFRSTDAQFRADGTITVNGELTIKGITKPFVATGTYEPLVEDPYGTTRTAVVLTAVVDRRDWALTWQAPLPKGGDVLGYDVTLSTHVELTKQS